MKIRTPRILGAVLVAGLTVGLAAPAFADTATTRPADSVSSTDTENAKVRCVQAIDRRLDTLDKVQGHLDEADFVTEDHAASLKSIIDSTNSGLRDLRDDIEGSADPDEIRVLCESIGPDYRVYLVVVPQSRLTARADRISHSQARVDDLTAKFDAAADRAKEAGIDVSEAVALRDQAVDQFDAAYSTVEGVADSVLAVTPAGYDEGPGQVTLQVASESISTSLGQLQSAHTTGQEAVQALKEAISGS